MLQSQTGFFLPFNNVNGHHLRMHERRSCNPKRASFFPSTTGGTAEKFRELNVAIPNGLLSSLQPIGWVYPNRLIDCCNPKRASFFPSTLLQSFPTTHDPLLQSQTGFFLPFNLDREALATLSAKSCNPKRASFFPSTLTASSNRKIAIGCNPKRASFFPSTLNTFDYPSLCFCRLQSQTGFFLPFNEVVFADKREDFRGCNPKRASFFPSTAYTTTQTSADINVAIPNGLLSSLQRRLPRVALQAA